MTRRDPTSDADLDAKDAEIARLRADLAVAETGVAFGRVATGQRDLAWREIARLEQWKAEALPLLDRIHEIAETIPDRKLGSRDVESIAAELARLRAEREELMSAKIAACSVPAESRTDIGMVPVAPHEIDGDITDGRTGDTIVWTTEGSIDAQLWRMP